MSVTELRAALVDVVGVQHVLVDPDTTRSFTTDWSGRWTGPAAAVVRPADTAETAAVVATVRDAGAVLIPQGGNTGLVGGSVPREHDPDGRPQVVLSTTRLTRLDPVDVSACQVVARAGVTLAALQKHARLAGLMYAVDLAARDTATVGGTVSTNAGGLHVVAYGDTRRQLIAVEAVLADGSVVSRLAAPTSDASAYDLAQLVCGTEGTLAVVTAARLRLIHPPETSTVALYGLADLAAAYALIQGARRILAAELVMASTMEVVLAATTLPRPFVTPWPVYLLLEVDGDALPEPPRASDVAVDPRVWAYRERAPEAIATTGIGHKFDIAVPAERTEALLQTLPVLLHPFEVFVFGHIGVGNLHVNVVTPNPHDLSVDDRVLRLVADLGGSVAAEHGVGVAKTRWLGLTRQPADLDVMRRVKTALDPDRSLNPGVLLG